MGKYEEALERAKEWEREHPNGYVIRDMMEFIFPGYNDSEDECTRKELIHFILYKAGQLLDEETEHKFVAYLEKQKEQKPAARENDFVSKPQTSVEILRHYLVWAGNSESEEDCPYTWRALADAIRDGIKALEEQKLSEFKWEDDEKMFQLIENVIRVYGKTQGEWIGGIDMDTLVMFLRRLRDNKPAEWSEEDENMRNSIIEAIHNLWPYEHRDKCIDWLKSLRPQHHWKPSEEHFQGLRRAITKAEKGSDAWNSLTDLYEQLKKL